MSDIGPVKTNLPSQTVRKPEKKPISTETAPVPEDKKAKQPSARDTVANRITRLFIKQALLPQDTQKLDEDIGKKLARKSTLNKPESSTTWKKYWRKPWIYQSIKLQKTKLIPTGFIALSTWLKTYFHQPCRKFGGKYSRLK